MDGDYQTWHLHNKVTGILNIIDLLPTSSNAHLSIVTVNTVHSLNACRKIFLSLFSFRVSFNLVKNWIIFFLCLIGRAVCDGREADLYEAQARQPLHAGPGLFKDLFLRAVPLHSL